MKRNKHRIAGMAALLAAVMLLSPVCSALSPLRASAAGSTADPLDFSDPNFTNKSELSAGALLTQLLLARGRGETASSAEVSYLNRYCQTTLYYTPRLPNDLVTVSVSGDGSQILVTAQEHEAEGRNGKTVRWIPDLATYNGDTRALTEGEVAFPREEGNYLVTVSYRGEAELPCEVANLLLNYAYEDLERAELVSAKLDVYRQEYPLWQANQRAWEDYAYAMEDYEDAMDDHRAALARWEENQAAWVQYGKDQAAYLASKAEWDAHRQAVTDYQNSPEYLQYKRDEEAYQAIIDNQSAIQTAMMAMESIFIKPYNLNDLYTALQNGEIVTMLEQHKAKLMAAAGVKEADITEMRDSSERLNELLGQYAEKRELSEADAFDFYKTNYAEISSRFNTLYDKMRVVLTGTVYNLMCGYLDAEYGAEMGSYKKWRIKNVLCHIYLICQCLDDEEQEKNPQWWFYNDVGDAHSYYFGELLDQELIITDTNSSDPSSLTWMEIPAEGPVAPPAPTPPAAAELGEPLAPPAPWEKPTEPTKPQEPPAMWEEPTLPEGVEVLAKVASLSGETIEKREETAGGQKLALPAVTLAATANNVPVVYGMDGEIRADLDPFDLPDTLESYRTDTHIYTFVCWSASPDEILPTEGSRYLYPYCERVERLYEVIFSVAGTDYTREFRWGELPQFDGSTNRASDAQYDYSFSEWSPPLEAVRQEGLRFEAKYEAKTRSYEARFDLSYRVISKQVLYGTVPVAPTVLAKYTLGNRVYEFTGQWEPPLTEIRENTTYRAVYTSRPLTQLPSGGEPQITEDDRAYSVTAEGDRIFVGELLALAGEKGKAVTVTFSTASATVSMDRDAARRLMSAGDVCLSLTRTDSGGGTALALRITNAEGEPLEVKEGLRLSYEMEAKPQRSLSVTAHYDSGLWKTVLYRVTDRQVEFLAEANATYRIEPIYRLTVGTGENGTVYAENSSYRAGDLISLTVLPRTEYRIGSVLLKNLATGETVTVDSLEGLTMPAYDLELTVEFVPVLYTVTFEYHGGSVVATYKRGEMPKIPEIEKNYEENGYFYTFLGWSSPVTMVKGDAVYTATYFSVPVEEKSDSGEGGAWGRILLRYGLPALLILLGVAAGITVPLVVRGRKKKKLRRLLESAEEEKTAEEEDHGPTV